jgi:lipoprotein-anchoring transpeptidase ErfK/SrfK
LIAKDAGAFGRFPDGARIANVSVSRLTVAEAASLCRRRLTAQANVPVELKVDSEVYTAAPADLSMDFNYDKMARDAYDRAWNVNVVERLIRRFLGRPKTVDMPVITTYDPAKLQAFVNGVMPAINCKPRNAYMDVSQGEAHLVASRDGRQADSAKVLAAAQASLRDGRRAVIVPVDKKTPPAVTRFNIGKFILVNQAAHTLRLYEGEKLLAEWPVAVGSPKYPTVIGEWKVVKVEKNPTWYNRGSTWAENMPEMIPPGPNNPLGTRAITINGGGVLIHGTYDTGSIGSSASHGCVRMRVPDVEALFPHAFVGMPVYIIKAAGQPNFDCSRRPFWWGAE